MSLETARFGAADWLRQQYLKRRSKNPSYSLRAFARSLQMPPGRLSEILNEKRPISRGVAQKIADTLGVSYRERRMFLGQVEAQRLRHRLRSLSSLTSSRSARSVSVKYWDVPQDSYEIYSDPLYVALLSLLDTDHPPESVQDLARRLGRPSIEVHNAITRLERVGLVTKEGAYWRPTQSSTTSTTDVPCGALRRGHLASIKEAASALEDLPIGERDFSSISIATSPARIHEAKELIREFRRRLCELLEDGERTEVYSLNVQFYPVTRRVQ